MSLNKLTIHYKFIFVFVFVFAHLFLFQNCSFHKAESQFSYSGFKLASFGNGGPYEGKPDGNYYRYLPEFNCMGQPSPLSTIEINNEKIHYEQSDLLNCHFDSKDLNQSDLDLSPFQSMIMGYREGIYEHYANKPNDIPAALAEVWCQANENPSNFEIISHFDRSNQSALARMMYSSESFSLNTVPDFSVSRVIQDHQVIIKAENFSLTIDRDQLIPSRPGEFVGQLFTRIDSQSVEKKLRCRLGGELDPQRWPLRKLTEHSIEGSILASPLNRGPRNFIFTASVQNTAISQSDNQTGSQFVDKLFLFSEKNEKPIEIDTKQNSFSLGISDYKFSLDGRFIYFRNDDGKQNKTFYMYQLDLLTFKIRQLPGEGLIGAGINSILKGGFQVFSDGTLVYVTTSKNSNMQLAYLTADKPHDLPQFIQSPLIAGQSTHFAYSPFSKEILFMRRSETTEVAGRAQLFSKNVITNEELLLLQDVSSVGFLEAPGREFNNLLYFYDHGVGPWSITTTKLFIYNLKENKLIDYGTQTSAENLGSQATSLLVETQSAYHLLNENKDYTLPENFSKRFLTSSKDEKNIWWLSSTNQIFKTDFLGQTESVCLLNKKAKVVSLLAMAESDAVALVYREDLQTLQTHVLSAQDKSCKALASTLPLIFVDDSKILSASVSPDNKYIVFTANISVKEITNFMAYAIPMSGKAPLAITAYGMVKYDRSQIVYSKDSSKIYLLFETMNMDFSISSIGLYKGNIFSWELPQ